MIQDLKLHDFHNEYKHASPVEGDSIFVFKGREILIKKEKDEGEYSLPKYEAFADLEVTFTYLFTVDQENYYLADVDEGFLEGYSYENINLLRTLEPQHVAFAAVTAYHLFNWYQTNRFCGVCGKPMVHSNKERALCCKNCGQTVYPRISPAVIVGVTDGNRLLLTKYAGRDYKRYALVAGFCEIGESAEKTVEREVMEEVGLKVKNIRYYKSQPWGFGGELLLGYFAEVDGSNEIQLEEKELSEGIWVEREDISAIGDGVTLTSEMILHFKNNG